MPYQSRPHEGLTTESFAPDLRWRLFPCRFIVTRPRVDVGESVFAARRSDPISMGGNQMRLGYRAMLRPNQRRWMFDEYSARPPISRASC